MRARAFDRQRRLPRVAGTAVVTVGTRVYLAPFVGLVGLSITGSDVSELFATVRSPDATGDPAFAAP